MDSHARARKSGMEVTTTFDTTTRSAWRAWLAAHHADEREIWLLLRRDVAGSITYLDAVEEALCFGWIDGIAKRHDGATAQRFTPRRARSHWTELNKERARRLIRAGKMTEAGRRSLPDLSDEEVRVAADIRARLEAVEGAWEYFESLPPLYQRRGLGYIEEVRRRNPKEWEKRMNHFLTKTAKRETFGNWDDSQLPRTRDRRPRSAHQSPVMSHSLPESRTVAARPHSARRMPTHGFAAFVS